MVNKYCLVTKANQNATNLSLNTFTMPRKIHINKYQGNTHYSVIVEDSYNQEHHLGYYNDLSPEILSEIEADAEMLWQNEVKNEPSSMDLAISALIKLDEQSGIHFTDDRGNHRDGLD